MECLVSLTIGELYSRYQEPPKDLTDHLSRPQHSPTIIHGSVVRYQALEMSFKSFFGLKVSLTIVVRGRSKRLSNAINPSSDNGENCRRRIPNRSKRSTEPLRAILLFSLSLIRGRLYRATYLTPTNLACENTHLSCGRTLLTNDYFEWDLDLKDKHDEPKDEFFCEDRALPSLPTSPARLH